MQNNVDLQWTPEENTHFGPIQINVCQSKANGETLQTIMERFNLSKSTVYSILDRTLEGNIWGNDKGGPRGYLGDVDSDILVSKVKECCQSLNCMRTIDVLQVAVDLRHKRYERAMFLSKKLSSDESAKHFKPLLVRLLPFIPSSSWVSDFAQRNEIPIKNAITLEELRRKFCNCTTVRSFYTKNRNDFLTTHPRLMWNADEASHTSSKKFKVLAGSNLDNCVVSKTGPEPHFTTMYSFNAAGEKMLPFIILPNVMDLPHSLSYDFQAIYATQKSGWMTSHLFSIWCVFFASKISQIRMELPTAFKNQRAVLIVDNHPSRINSEAIEFLISQNIKIITLPAHCSHVLQPFDVAVAACVKAKITRARLVDYNPRFYWEFNSKIGKIRYAIVRAIVMSWQEVSIDTLLNGWEKSGIFPFNMEKGLNNNLTNQNPPPPNRIITFSISNQDLSSPWMRLQIAQKNYGIRAVPHLFSIPRPNYNSIYQKIKIGKDLHNGILNSPLPNIHIEMSPNIWVRVFGE